MPQKTYEPFWIGQARVSRCSRCGAVLFHADRQAEHDKEKCPKERLKPLTDEERGGPDAAA